MEGDAGEPVAVPATGGAEIGDAVHANGEVGARRAQVVARLLERGMSVRVLYALLPGWDDTIRAATGRDTIRAATSRDTIRAATSRDTIRAATGRDTIRAVTDSEPGPDQA